MDLWTKREAPPGAPKSPRRADYPTRTASGGKIHFEKIATTTEILPVEDTPPLPSEDQIVYRTEVRPGDVVKEDRPEWRPRKRPRGKGKEKYKEAIAVINAEIDSHLPKPAENLPTVDPTNTAEFQADLLNFVASGGTVWKYCKQVGVFPSQITRLQKKNPEFKAALAQAREEGFDAMAEEALRIASEPSIQAEEVVTYDKEGNVVSRAIKRADATYARKLAFQARLQLLAKWAPKKYGEKIEEDDTGGRAAKILQARRRVAEGQDD